MPNDWIDDLVNGMRLEWEGRLDELRVLGEMHTRNDIEPQLGGLEPRPTLSWVIMTLNEVIEGRVHTKGYEEP